VRKLPPGGYQIKVYVTSSDAPDAVEETNFKTIGGKGKTFIRIE
jgi:hypothetical protein